MTTTAAAAMHTLVFNNTDWANIGDAGGLQNSATAGNFYIALFTATPSDAGGGTECNYTSYARAEVARSAAGWTISNRNVTNAAAITFPACGGGTNTAVAWAVMTASTSGSMLWWGPITSPAGGLAISTGITPEIAAGALDIDLAAGT
jgi:hypothetical protein